MPVLWKLLGQDVRTFSEPFPSHFIWFAFQQGAEAHAIRVTLVPPSDEDEEDKCVTSEKGMSIVRSDGMPGIFSPSLVTPLHPASFFNLLICLTNIRGTRGFVPEAGVQRAEIQHLPSRSSLSSWGDRQTNPRFLE